MYKKSFLRDNPLACVLVPAIFVVVTVALVWVAANAALAPYKTLISWFFNNNVTVQPTDLFEQASGAIQDGVAPSAEKDVPASLPLSSITYPAKGDRYGRITVEGTTVDAPLYYGDANAQLNAGVGTYKDNIGVGLPGEGKTILLAGHNNTFFNDLQHVEEGATVTIETHYGTYTYEVTEMKVLDHQDTSAYDFSRTDENLILYTCYPFDAIGFTPDRYFVYGKYISGPVLDANS